MKTGAVTVPPTVVDPPTVRLPPTEALLNVAKPLVVSVVKSESAVALIPANVASPEVEIVVKEPLPPTNAEAVTEPLVFTLEGVMAPRVRVSAGVVPWLATVAETPFAVAIVTAVTAVLQLLSPRRNVVVPAVPVKPNRATGTVPDARFDAFRAVIPLPGPEMTPVTPSVPPIVVLFVTLNELALRTLKAEPVPADVMFPVTSSVVVILAELSAVVPVTISEANCA